jgi:WhiB family redox-sensing transcriptional regulator
VRRKKVNRRNVDWDKANCRGINTEIFFVPQSEFQSRALERGVLRKVCARCPIRQQCLEVAVAYEEKGYWGGMSESERNLILEENFDTPVITSFKKDLIQFGLDYDEILKIRDIEIKNTWGQNAN